MSEAPCRAPNAIGREAWYRILWLYLLFLGLRQNVPPISQLPPSLASLLALLYYWDFGLYRFSHDRKIVKLEDLQRQIAATGHRARHEAKKTLAELNSPSRKEELDGMYKMLRPRVSTSDMRWMDCRTGRLDPRVTGSGRGRM